MSTYRIEDVKLVNILDQAEKDLQEMKSTQFVGRRVLATKVSTENRKWESQNYNGVGSPDPVGSNVYRNIYFTADSQKNPYGRLIVKFYDINGQQIITQGAGEGEPKLLYYLYTITNVDDGKLQWQVDIRGPVVPHFFIQFSVAGTDSGTVTSTPVVF